MKVGLTIQVKVNVPEQQKINSKFDIDSYQNQL